MTVACCWAEPKQGGTLPLAQTTSSRNRGRLKRGTFLFEPVEKAILEPDLGFEPAGELPAGEQLAVAGLAEPVVGRAVLG